MLFGGFGFWVGSAGLFTIFLAQAWRGRGAKELQERSGYLTSCEAIPVKAFSAQVLKSLRKRPPSLDVYARADRISISWRVWPEGSGRELGQFYKRSLPAEVFCFNVSLKRGSFYLWFAHGSGVGKKFLV